MIGSIKISQKSAVYSTPNYEYKIQLNGDSISISPTSDKSKLNLLANLCGYTYEETDTAVQLASDLIDFINLKAKVNLPPDLTITSMQQVDQYFENVQQFSDFIGVNVGSIYSWRNGSQKITANLAKRAYLNTQGQIDLFKFSEYGG